MVLSILLEFIIIHIYLFNYLKYNPRLYRDYVEFCDMVCYIHIENARYLVRAYMYRTSHKNFNGFLEISCNTNLMLINTSASCACVYVGCTYSSTLGNYGACVERDILA